MRLDDFTFYKQLLDKNAIKNYVGKRTLFMFFTDVVFYFSSILRFELTN